MAIQALTAEQKQIFIHLGQVIQLRRRTLSLTQEELALKASVHRTYISDIERGRRNVTFQTLWAIAEALAIQPSHFWEKVEKLE